LDFYLGVTLGAVRLNGGDMDSATAGTGVVERYLKCLADHDWDGLATTIAGEGLVVREGPFCDVVEGKERYVAYLREILTQLEGHRLDVHRVSHVDARLSCVELTEAFEFDGAPAEWPECILFEQRDDGLISRVSVFFKQRPRFTGRDTVMRFLVASAFAKAGDIAMVPTAANAQAAVAEYRRAADGVLRAHSIHVLTTGAHGVAGITVFLDPALFPTFGLPPSR
jgi:hypothetical protein